MTLLDSPTSAPRHGGAGDALVVERLDIAYRVQGRERLALSDVSLSVGPHESYGLVGESGSGKSTLALAVARYLPRNGRVASGSISVSGHDVLALGGKELREFRSSKVSMVYQEPGRALNPSIRVGRQVAEVYEVAGVGRREAAERAEAMLGTVRISDPAKVMHRYPHELSGGMLQRVVIAMALASEPALLVLDEPTTALDATVEAEVLDLVAALRKSFDTAILFISHNLGVIAEMCDRVGILYAGELVEEGPAAEVFASPRHPYTVGLLRCIPRGGRRKQDGPLDTVPGFLPPPGEIPSGCIFAPRCGLADERCRTEAPALLSIGPARSSRCHYHERAAELPHSAPGRGEVAAPGTGAEAGAGAGGAPVVSLRGVSKTFSARGEQVRALAGVSLDVAAGSTLGLVGESGSGKTTLGRVLLGLTAPDDGSMVEVRGERVAPSAGARTRRQLKSLQMVFQDPDSALNRRHSVRRLISRPLAKLAGLTGSALVDRLMHLVRATRMEERHLPLRPAQLSGGLKQRVAIARAFAGAPEVVVCDEPTSALDVSVQAAILNLLVDLQSEDGATYVFISHDLGVVRYLSDRIAVLYLGRLMEVGPAEAVFSGPHHPYTEALLSAVPSVDGLRRGRIRLEGEVPSAGSPPSGCVFHTRCPRRLASGVCDEVEPPLAEVAPGHMMSCHIPIDELRRLQSRPRPG